MGAEASTTVRGKAEESGRVWRERVGSYLRKDEEKEKRGKRRSKAPNTASAAMRVHVPLTNPISAAHIPARSAPSTRTSCDMGAWRAACSTLIAQLKTRSTREGSAVWVAAVIIIIIIIVVMVAVVRHQQRHVGRAAVWTGVTCRQCPPPPPPPPTSLPSSSSSSLLFLLGRGLSEAT